MKRLLFLAGLVGFAVWRARTLDACDREQAFGRYADVAPVQRNDFSSIR